MIVLCSPCILFAAICCPEHLEEPENTQDEDDNSSIIELQPLNPETDRPPSYAQALEKKSFEIEMTPPDFTQVTFTDQPIPQTPLTSSTPPLTSQSLAQYWTPESSPRISQSPLQLYSTPAESLVNLSDKYVDSA